MTDNFTQQVRTVLTDNILSFWLKYDKPEGAILNSRIIWSFSAAYKALGRPEYLDAALRAYEWFKGHFLDPDYGGVFWSLDNFKKQLYAQGFAIYGLSELYKVTSDMEVLDLAVELYRVVEDNFADKVYGGYIEALSQDFSPLEDMSLSAHDINADKTMNSHLHILEAYANLYQVWPDEGLKERVVELLDLAGGTIMAPDGHLQLYFKRDWTVLEGAVSFGHDIETSWLALECAFALKDESVIERVRPWALKLGLAGNEGLLPDGSMRYEKHPDGSFDDERQWWVQAEAVVGNLWLWKYHGLSVGYDNSSACWKYIRENLIDYEGGEWWWAILPDGSIDRSHEKAGFWKCPYHNTRMCLQVISL